MRLSAGQHMVHTGGQKLCQITHVAVTFLASPGCPAAGRGGSIPPSCGAPARAGLRAAGGPKDRVSNLAESSRLHCRQCWSIPQTLRALENHRVGSQDNR